MDILAAPPTITAGSTVVIDHWAEPAVVTAIDPDGRLHVTGQHIAGTVPANHAHVIENRSDQR